MSNHIDLVLPGLFNLPLNEFEPEFLKTELPALNQLLSDSKTELNNRYEFEPIIADCIGWSDWEQLPFAQAYVDEDEVDNRHRHLLCRGVHLKADMHNALVIPLEDNRSDQDDEAIILKDLMALFSEDCELKCLGEGLWLMRLKNCDPSDCYPHYLSVIGRKANQFIEQSRQALPWYKLMNEMQMFMHQHSINQNRLATGLLPINSLWFWGAGSLPELKGENSHWFCDNKQLTRFAYSLGIQNSSLEQLATMNKGEDSVVIDLSLLEALKTSNGESLTTKLESLEEIIFKPLMAAAKLNRSSLRLRAGYEFDFTMSPLVLSSIGKTLSRFKFWRQRKSLIDISPRNSED